MSAPLGVGLDLVDVARISRLISTYGERVLTRLLTDGEREYCLGQAVPARHVAARVAVKEAAYKALCCAGNTVYLAWRDLEVIREPGGLPRLELQGRAREVADRLGVGVTMVSISHTDSQAAAVVLVLSDPQLSPGADHS